MDKMNHSTLHERLIWGSDVKVKFRVCRSHLSGSVKSVLDVGCRDGVLRSYLPEDIEYIGVDLIEGINVTHALNIEHGLPFPDRTFDAVFALDVLEHVDKFHYVFGELVRVARQQVIVQLPNMYHWSARLDYLLAKYPDKYRLTSEPVEDRHRWIPSHEQAVKFAEVMASHFTCGLKIIPMSFGRRYRIPDRLLSHLSLNVSARSTLLIFQLGGSSLASWP
jgi:SAM-dependent methyltransferase